MNKSSIICIAILFVCLLGTLVVGCQEQPEPASSPTLTPAPTQPPQQLPPALTSTVTEPSPQPAPTENSDLDQVETGENESTLFPAVQSENESENRPVGLATIHFELATEDIDMTELVADYDIDKQKSVFYMSEWPAVVEESKILFIPYTEEGTVYVCPQASCLDEVNPRCHDKVILEPGEVINGMMAVPTIYDGQAYYIVYGFVNGGGGVNLPPVADANGPYFGEEGSPITFTAANSTDSNGDPLQYRWDFNGDGIWDTEWLEETIANYIFGDDLSGIAILEVSDGERTDTAMAIVSVSS